MSQTPTVTSRAVPGSISAQLARWVSELQFRDIPQDVLDHARLVLLDTLGCGLFGSTTRWGRIIAEFVQGSGAGDEATVWGTGAKVPAVAAPLANGTFVHAFELDDLHPPAMIHVGASVVPAALAIAELRAHGPSRGAWPGWLPRGAPDGEEFMTALIAGFETGIRVGLCTGTRQLARGFHPSPNSGTFAAAAAASRLLHASPEQTLNALGIAGSFGGYLMAAQYGAMVKRVHQGRASQSGLVAALLAAHGLTGITEVLEAPYGGFAHAFAGGADLSEAVEGLGTRWETLQVAIKAYPSCGSTHTSIDAYLSILEERPDLRWEDIDRIDVRCTTATYEHVGWPYRPDSITAAQMNLSYTLAVLAVDRELFVDQYREERLADPRVLQLVERIHVQPDATLDALGREGRHAVVLTVYTKDSRSYQRHIAHARGTRHRPLSKEEVILKYEKLASRVLGPDRASVVRETVLRISDQRDVSVLALLLAPGGTSSQ